jgi:hypothetical protein
LPLQCGGHHSAFEETPGSAHGKHAETAAMQWDNAPPRQPLRDTILVDGPVKSARLRHAFRAAERLQLVIARSEADEAIQTISAGAFLDCFAEPVIGRAFARPVGSQ